MGYYSGAHIWDGLENTPPGQLTFTTWELRAPIGTKTKLIECGWMQNGNNGAQWWGIGRPAAAGIDPRYFIPLTDETDGNAPPAQTQWCFAWRVPPTAPVNYVRRFADTSTVALGRIVTFSRGMGLSSTTGSAVLYTIGAGLAQLNMWVVVEE